MTQHLPILSIIVLFFGGLLTVILGNNRVLRNIIVSVSALMSSIFIMYLIKPILLDGNIITYWMGNWVPENGWAIGIGLEIDGVGLFFGIIASITILLSGIYSFKYMNTEDNLRKYYVVFLVLAGSILGFIFTGDLFNMFIMIEIITLASVGLTAFRNKSAEALAAAFKLIATGSLSSLLILLGIILLYAQFHTLNMAQLAAMLHNNYTPVTLFAFAALIGGFAVKSFLVPCHIVVPDICETAPAPISMLISGIVDKTGLYGIIRIVFIIYTSMSLMPMRLMFVFLGTISMLYGVIMSLIQQNLKRFLAYHSISQLGYIFTAVGLSTIKGLTGGLYHTLNHTLFLGLLFLCAGGVLYRTGTTDLNRLGGLARKMPQTTLIFLIGAFSICGLPPFNGFVSKWLIYKSIFDEGYVLVSIAAVLTSVIAVVSFIRVSKTVFFGELPSMYENITEAPLALRIPMWIMAALCLATGIIPKIIVKYLINPAVLAVFNIQKYIDTMMGSGFMEKWFGEPISPPAAGNGFSGYSSGIAWIIIYIVVLAAFTITAAAGELKSKCMVSDADFVKGDILQCCAMEEQVNAEKNVFLNRYKQYVSRFFKFMWKTNSVTVNDSVIWIISTMAMVLVYLFIFV